MKLKDLKKDESIGQVLLQRLYIQRLYYKDCLFFISVSDGKENKNKELYYIFEYILMLLITY